MIDNPHCRCGRHLGMPYHTTREHNSAVAEAEENHESAMVVSRETVGDIADWCGGRSVVEHDGADYSKTYPALNVPTNHGVRRAAEGDFVIRQEDGSFEVMGPTDYRNSQT